MRKSQILLRVVGILGACGLMGVAGCGGLKIVPVSGKALVDGKALTRGVVWFNPDPAKGNTARVACRGRINGDGLFEMFTDDGTKLTKGVPVGSYKVTLATTPGDDAPLPVHNKFLDFEKTDLTVEVVPDPKPDAYELKFTNK
jgi:hypothetical protein